MQNLLGLCFVKKRGVVIISVCTWEAAVVHWLTAMASKKAGQNIFIVIFLSSLYAHMPRVHNIFQNNGHYKVNFKVNKKV